MKIDKKILLFASIASLSLLLILFIFQNYDSNILKLDIKWIIVAGVPMMVGILYSGIIKSFKGFGIELETNLAEKIELSLIGTMDCYPSPELSKETMGILYGLTLEQKSKIERLQFVYGKRGYYESSAIIEYIRELKSLKFVEIINSEGRFIALLPINKFKREINQGFSDESDRRIELLIRSIGNESISDDFNDLITDTIKKDDSLLQAFKKFNNSKQGKSHNGDQILPVIDSNDKMIGLTRRNKLTNRIAEQVLKSEK
jgi:hypothetical protein